MFDTFSSIRTVGFKVKNSPRLWKKNKTKLGNKQEETNIKKLPKDWTGAKRQPEQNQEHKHDS